MPPRTATRRQTKRRRSERQAPDDAIHVALSDAYRDLAAPLGSYRYRVYYGGRGAAKSWSVARAILLHGAQRLLRVLCTREYQTSIRESVHRLFADQIEAMGLGAVYAVEQSVIRSIHGGEIIFAGIRRDPHQLKSLEGVDLCWVEEAEAVSERSWSILIPTVRKPGSEIWVTFNPHLPTDPAWQRFVEHPPERAVVRRVSWRDNRWLSRELLDEREALLARDPEAEAHVWGGEPWARTDDRVILDRIEVAPVEPREGWSGPYHGADWGFARDPTVLVRCWVGEGRLWIEREERGIGWTLDELVRRVERIPGAREHALRGDPSRPETIAELRRRGLRAESAPSWPGSVEDGIEHLRSYERIMIDPSCEGLIQEGRLWRYATDARTGDVLPRLVDGHDHGWDAIRYALAPLIRQRPSWGLANG